MSKDYKNLFYICIVYILKISFWKGDVFTTDYYSIFYR